MSYKLFSVDDHLLEPPDLWISRMPSKHREDCMRLVRHDGVDVWSYEGQSAGTFKMFATAGLPPDQWDMGTINYDEMHPACFDPKARSEALHDGRDRRVRRLPDRGLASLDVGSSRPKTRTSRACTCRRTTTSCSTSGVLQILRSSCRRSFANCGMPSWLQRRSAVALRAALAR